MNKNQQYESALALLDFCENDLSSENVAKYFNTHDPDRTTEQRNAIMLTALSLIKNA